MLPTGIDQQYGCLLCLHLALIVDRSPFPCDVLSTAFGLPKTTVTGTMPYVQAIRSNRIPCLDTHTVE
eukprot:jgi/Psemu1/308647/fgenesh1_kg.430_\